MPSRDPFPPARSGDPSGSWGANRRADPFEESIADELIGLDPDDPETQAFADHLRRMRNDRPSFTVEGYLRGVSDFADSANRARGGRRLGAVLLVLLLLLVAGYLITNALGFVVSTWLSPPESPPSAQVSGMSGDAGAGGISVGA
jgi:hypothetical protein